MINERTGLLEPDIPNPLDGKAGSIIVWIFTIAIAVVIGVPLLAIAAYLAYVYVCGIFALGSTTILLIVIIVILLHRRA